MPKPERIIISGGGTGGHIFPAIAIANALKKELPGVDILFVGAEGRMEMEKVPEAGYKIEGLWISGLQRSLKLSNLVFPFKVISSLYKSAKIISRFKPQAAIGVGGYASGPLLYVASRKGIPCLLQEQNSYPGITNKLLAQRASKICVAYEGMDRFFPKEKIVMTGNPVREDMVKTEGKREEAAAFFGLDKNIKTILVVGGSQGARSINKSILLGLHEIKNSGYQLIWQCGKNSFQDASTAVNAIGSPAVKVFDFIKRMDLAYAMADVIVSRAGASTVSELSIVGKPAILVPLPTAAEDHQTKNCEALTTKNAAILIKDHEAANRLVHESLALVNDPAKLKTLSENISKLALKDAATVIAGEVIRMTEN